MNFEELLAAMSEWSIRKGELGALLGRTACMERNWRSGRLPIPRYVKVFFDCLQCMGAEKGEHFLDHLRSEVAERA